MFDIEKELRAFSRNKEVPSEALRESTRALVRREYNHTQANIFPPVHAQGASSRRRSARWVVIFAAAVAMMLGVTLVLSPPKSALAASYYTVDINPSMVLSMDANDIVINASAANADAESLLDNLSLIGLSIEDALSSIIRVSAENGWLQENGHVLVAHFGDTPGLTNEQVSDIVTKETPKTVSVLVLQSGKQDYEDAKKDNKEAGIELLKKSARDLGIDATADTDTLIREIRSRQDKPESKPVPSASPNSGPSSMSENTGSGGQIDSDQNGNAGHDSENSKSQDDKDNTGKTDDQQGTVEKTPHPGNGKPEESRETKESQSPANSNQSNNKEENKGGKP
jgi:hypothetical protein